MYITEYETKVYKNSAGELHRLDGPAKDLLCGYKSWWKDSLLHRTDGPAMEKSNGKKFWGILNKSLEEKDFNSWIIRIKIFV